MPVSSLNGSRLHLIPALFDLSGIVLLLPGLFVSLPLGCIFTAFLDIVFAIRTVLIPARAALLLVPTRRRGRCIAGNIAFPYTAGDGRALRHVSRHVGLAEWGLAHPVASREKIANPNRSFVTTCGHATSHFLRLGPYQLRIVARRAAVMRGAFVAERSVRVALFFARPHVHHLLAVLRRRVGTARPGNVLTQCLLRAPRLLVGVLLPLARAMHHVTALALEMVCPLLRDLGNGFVPLECGRADLGAPGIGLG
mmetsp:Transcript_14120/g.22438  ORF Transcript_14120/g.22438 Transcript_14120/m.22438 type:complete len:253 (+) Transcript_14120:2752-3510(+)